jgi:hypothetical protein
MRFSLRWLLGLIVIICLILGAREVRRSYLWHCNLPVTYHLNESWSEWQSHPPAEFPSTIEILFDQQSVSNAKANANQQRKMLIDVVVERTLANDRGSQYPPVFPAHESRFRTFYPEFVCTEVEAKLRSLLLTQSLSGEAWQWQNKVKVLGWLLAKDDSALCELVSEFMKGSSTDRRKVQLVRAIEQLHRANVPRLQPVFSEEALGDKLYSRISKRWERLQIQNDGEKSVSPLIPSNQAGSSDEEYVRKAVEDKIQALRGPNAIEADYTKDPDFYVNCVEYFRDFLLDEVCRLPVKEARPLVLELMRAGYGPACFYAGKIFEGSSEPEIIRLLKERLRLLKGDRVRLLESLHLYECIWRIHPPSITDFDLPYVEYDEFCQELVMAKKCGDLEELKALLEKHGMKTFPPEYSRASVSLRSRAQLNTDCVREVFEKSKRLGRFRRSYSDVPYPQFVRENFFAFEAASGGEVELDVDVIAEQPNTAVRIQFGLGGAVHLWEMEEVYLRQTVRLSHAGAICDVLNHILERQGNESRFVGMRDYNPVDIGGRCLVFASRDLLRKLHDEFGVSFELGSEAYFLSTVNQRKSK